MSKLSYLRDTLGFDLTKNIPFSGQYRVRCGSCESMVVNGTPLHERGCPNDTHECAGCNARIPVNARYCADCQ